MAPMVSGNTIYFPYNLEVFHFHVYQQECMLDVGVWMLSLTAW